MFYALIGHFVSMTTVFIAMTRDFIGMKTVVIIYDLGNLR
ncbi:hypothetical protein PRABACTJOHN_04276 [Parabacteroides johnsonii DSM 18315]|uniref:Uncharacterized protein n=1 Tax=Parabacteroides johnsonii DSM 18315 TaxID=537006 RepID=B7BGS7_9BACT|nr:hypothetical protein PRABACTJOHN_04276 [Parabacteroides johnsonii DSM 18315]